MAAIPPTTIVMDKSGLNALTRRLKGLKSSKGNEIMRNALKASKRPPEAHIKKGLRQLRTTSKQTTGATFRAQKSRVSFPQKGKPHTGYMRAGIDFDHVEHHMKNTSDLHARSKLKKRRRFVGVTNRGRRAIGKRQRVSKRYVVSYQKNALRLKKGQTSQKNRPGKYWHILEFGWKNRKVHRPWSGHKFIAKAFSGTDSEMLSSFTRILSAGLERNFR